MEQSGGVQIQQPQFVGGGPEVFVKNTFIDCVVDTELPVSERAARRFKTTPVHCDKCHFNEIGSMSENDISTSEAEGYSTDEDLEEQRTWSWIGPTQSSCIEMGNEGTEKPKMYWPAGMDANSWSQSQAFYEWPSADWCGVGYEDETHRKACHDILLRFSSTVRTLPARMPRGQTHALTHSRCSLSGVVKVIWHLDSRCLGSLHSSKKHAISPFFPIYFGSHMPFAAFKLLLYPGASQKPSAASGLQRGHIKLMCEEPSFGDSNGLASFCVSLGSGTRPKPFRGPACHDFACSAVAELPAEHNLWDLRSTVDDATMTLTVRVDILPHGSNWWW